MTNYERHLFSELVDVNWEINKSEHNSIVKMALISRYSQIVAQLEDSMGVAEWRNFMEMGKEMYASMGGYWDKRPEEVNRMMARVS